MQIARRVLARTQIAAWSFEAGTPTAMDLLVLAFASVVGLGPIWR